MGLYTKGMYTKGMGVLLVVIVTILSRERPASEELYPLLRGAPIFGCYYGVRHEGNIKIGDPVYELIKET